MENDSKNNLRDNKESGNFTGILAGETNRAAVLDMKRGMVGAGVEMNEKSSGQEIFGDGESSESGLEAVKEVQSDELVGEKSALVAGLLGIFLGSFGFQDFYLGYIKFGLVHLAMILVGLAAILGVGLNGIFWGGSFETLVIWGLGYLLLAVNSLWGLIEGIMCLMKAGKYGRDARGKRLKG